MICCVPVPNLYIFFFENLTPVKQQNETQPKCALRIYTRDYLSRGSKATENGQTKSNKERNNVYEVRNEKATLRPHRVHDDTLIAVPKRQIDNSTIPGSKVSPSTLNEEKDIPSNKARSGRKFDFENSDLKFEFVPSDHAALVSAIGQINLPRLVRNSISHPV